MGYFTLLAYVLVLFVRPQEWVPFMYGWRIQFVLMIVAGFVWLFMLISPREGKYRDAPQNWLMGGLFGAILLSHLGHGYAWGLQNAFSDFGKTVLLYFCVVTMVTTERRLRYLIITIAIGGLFLATHGILQGVTGYGFADARPLLQQKTVRVIAFGIFSDPNDLALMLVSIMPFLLQRGLTKGTGFIRRAFNLVLVIPLAVCIYYTNSRGGWLGLGAMLTAVIFLNYSKKVGIVLAVAGFLGMLALGPSRMGTVTAQESSAAGRIQAWGAGNRMLKQSPVWGRGYGMFDEASGINMVAHNSYVHCWSELGLLGYFFWLALLLTSLKDGWALTKIRPTDPAIAEWPAYAKASVASLVGYMSSAVFLSRTYIVPLYLFLAIFVVLRTIYVHHSPPEEQTGLFVKKDYRYVLAIELASIPALWLFIRATG